MKFDFRPYHLAFAVGSVLVLIAGFLVLAGESSTVYEFDLLTGETSTSTHHEYEWAAIVLCGGSGLGLGALAQRLRESDASWPAGIATVFTRSGVSASREPGVRAASTPLEVTTRVPAAEAHARVLAAVGPGPAPTAVPDLYVLEEREGRIALAFGAVGGPPVFVAGIDVVPEAAIPEAMVPEGKGTRLRFGFDHVTPVGGVPGAHGLEAAPVIDLLHANVERVFTELRLEGF